MDFADRLPEEGPVYTTRRGRKWYERLEPGTEVLCTPVHGATGRQRKMRVVTVKFFPTIQERPLAYPYADDSEGWTVVELE